MPTTNQAENKESATTMPQMTKSLKVTRGSVQNIYGYASLSGTKNTCGPASMATVMDYYGAPSSVPRQDNGHFDSDTYVKSIMDWSGAPDALGGVWGTTPMRIQESISRLPGRSAQWINKLSPDATLNCIRSEIDKGHPVFVLVDYGQLSQQDWYHLDWQVAYDYDSNGVRCKVSSGVEQSQYWSNAELSKVMQNNLPVAGIGQSDWNRTFIVTA